MWRRPRGDTTGDRLRRYRQAHGLTQAELARRLQIDRSTLSGYEMGKPVSRPDIRRRIEDVLSGGVDNDAECVTLSA